MLIIKDSKTKEVIIASERRHLILNWVNDQIESKGKRIPEFFSKQTTSVDTLYNSIESVQLLTEQIEDLKALYSDLSECWDMKTLNIIPDLNFESGSRYLVQTIDQKNLGIL